jgi:putative mRNA 3-end processing factor
VEGTNGRRLMDEGYILDELSNRKISVKSEVQYFDFSAHSDQESLVKMAHEVSPEKIILVHGQEKGCNTLAERLSEKYEVQKPKNGESLRLD